MLILIVEDSPELAECLQAGLEMHGHIVRLESTYLGALGALEESRPDGVISDGYFPYSPGLHGTSCWGLNILHLCVAEGIPTVLHTGDADLAMTARERGFVACMKPTRIEMLIASLESQRAGVEQP